MLFKLMNFYIYIFLLAGYSAIFSIRYPVGYPASQIRYAAGYWMSKKVGLSGRISGASLKYRRSSLNIKNRHYRYVPPVKK
jgi:hypothetical protein